MSTSERQARKIGRAGLWLFLVCAMFCAACSKSAVGGYGAGPAQAARQQAAPKTLQASVTPARYDKVPRQSGAAVETALPVLTASTRPAAGGVKQAAVRQPAGQNAPAASSRQVSRGKATAVRGDAVCRTVRAQMGTRYKYGGASPKTGFDCSGLLVWAYKQHGVSIPRTARAQSSAGTGVQRGKLTPGDIVVFKIRSGYHTGMYTGNNKFIHSPRTGSSVREDRLDSDYWKKAYIGARRVL